MLLPTLARRSHIVLLLAVGPTPTFLLGGAFLNERGALRRSAMDRLLDVSASGARILAEAPLRPGARSPLRVAGIAQPLPFTLLAATTAMGSGCASAGMRPAARCWSGCWRGW